MAPPKFRPVGPDLKLEEFVLVKWLSLLLLALCPIVAQGQQAETWKQYSAARISGEESVLPDFSFAGYRFSELPIPDARHKVFDVRDYGAVADDDKSDKGAIIAAVRAAESHGSGIIFFPVGRYLVNTDEDDETSIEVRGSNIVFRGENREDTILRFVRDLPPANPGKLFSSPYAISTAVDRQGAVLTDVTRDARRETKSINVADASAIKPGDWVILEVLNADPELVEYELGGLAPESAWTAILRQGVKVNERHQVASVQDDRVTFVGPIHYDVKARHGWRLREFVHLEEIGFENLTFEGEWQSEFVHHRSARDDGGWSILKLSHVTNSWIRNVVFRNVNRPAVISGSAATTVLNVRIEGRQGHHAISAAGGSTGILLAGIHDQAGMWHSVGVGGGSTTGTVIWRSSYPAHTSFESHASQPRTTLFDAVSGGFFQGRAGGARKNLPNHGRELVLWNFRELDDPDENFRFVAKDSNFWRFVPPIVVGFHGAGTTFAEHQAHVLESIGTPVEPESLFEAQLELRLGKVPDWIRQAKRDLPQHAAANRDVASVGARDNVNLRSADTQPAGYPTVLAVEAMAAQLTEQSAGRIRLKTYAGGQLGSEKATLELTILGGIDVNRTSLAPLNSIVPETGVFSLPFLFRSTDHMRNVLDGPIGEEVLASLEPHGLIGLAFYDAGARSMYNSKRPIHSPEDMAGMKVRVMNSSVFVDMMAALGANATPMGPGQVYESLALGTIDAAENNWPTFAASRHYEVAPHYSLTQHVMVPEVLVMSKYRWDKLSARDRDLVRRAARESVAVERELWDARVEDSREAMIAAGVRIVEAIDKKPFIDAVSPMYDKYLQDASLRALVERIRAVE